MNIDENIKKLMMLVLKRWKLIAIIGILCAAISVFYTANFTTLTYSSSVEFLAYAQDSRSEFSDSTTQQQTVSNTSKMNYAIKMLSTYIELFKTNEFNQQVANSLNEQYNTDYTAGTIKRSVSYHLVEETAMFRVIVTTTDPDLSYQIARQLETSIPEKMLSTNNGLVNASVEDIALKATTSESLQYPKKGVIGFLAGAVLAAAYVILRDLLDVRIKGGDELTDRYGIPVLGSIPEFEFKASSQNQNKATKGNTEEKGE